jgi:hypothetical protein
MVRLFQVDVQTELTGASFGILNGHTVLEYQSFIFHSLFLSASQCACNAFCRSCLFIFIASA